MSESDPLNYMDYRYGDSPIPVLENAALSDEHSHRALEALGIDSDDISNVTVRAAYAFERKNRVSYDSFGDSRNPSYGSSDDDIVVQVSFKLTDTHFSHAALVGVADMVRNAAVAEEYAAKVAKAEAMEADMAKIAAELDKARQELADFKKQ